MKQILTTTLLFISIIAFSQNKATPLNIDGKDIYVLLVNTNESNTIGSVNLTKEEATSPTSFENRIHLLIEKAATKGFDAISTRDGNTVQLLKYKNATNITAANVPNYFGKEVYFLSKPTQKYKVVVTKEITEVDLQKSFYNVANIYSKNEGVTFDAVIISGKNAEYIQYKK